MKIKDVIECSFQNWYHRFKKVTPKSIILPVPDGFISYLLADGIVLPESEKQESLQATNQKCDSDDDDDDDRDEFWDDDSETPTVQAPKFTEFNEKIKACIKELGGKVFPKMNWSSPIDASWIALNNSCCCTAMSDVYLLLKSSDCIVYDITKPFYLCSDYDPSLPEENLIEHQIPYFLILRKWVEINPDTEFRCFVKDGNLIGITQRDVSVYSEYLTQMKSSIIQDIVSFFTEHIQGRFSNDSFVFDVVRKKKDKVFLLDFGPFGTVTDSKLFEWDELKSEKFAVGRNCLPEYRCVSHNRGVQPRPHSYNAIPKDIVDISTGEDSFKFVDLLKLKIYQQQNDSSDDD